MRGVDEPAGLLVEDDPSVASLVQNALRFAAPLVRVESRAEDRGGEARAVTKVDDDGPGISTEDRPHVFERLYVARHTPRIKAGAGLGLTIVAELAGTMGGEVSVKDRRPTGTPFTVRYP